MSSGNIKPELDLSFFFKALVAAKVVYSNIMSDRKRCSYQSCSRTDKGVSAIGNVASLKCINPDNFTELVNTHLPDDIRITGIQRLRIISFYFFNK